MLNISDNLKTILKQNINALDVKVIYGTSTYSYDDINGLIITDSLTSSGIWTIGQAPSRQLSLSLIGNEDFQVSPYDETTTVTDGQGNSTVSVANNEEAETDIDITDFAELFDIDVDDTEGDDYEYPDNVEEITGDEITPRTFPEDWTLYPIVVKLGINNQTLDNTSKNDDIQEVVQQIIDDGDTVETLTIEPDSEDYDSDDDVEIEFDTLIDMMVEAETERENSGETEITYTYFTLGTFYVADRNDVTTERDSVEIVAYDKLYTLRNTAYTSTLTYPVALSSVTAEMATNYGITWNANVPNVTINRKPTGTVREALQKLALYCGANVNVEPEGDFEFVYPAEVDFPINSQMYHNLEMADDMALISKLDIISEGQTYDRYSTGDTTGKTASFFTDYITSQAEVDNIGTLSGLPFYWKPYSLTTPLYPHLEIGDIITAVDKNNEEQKLMIAKLEIVITHEGFIENFGCAIPTPQALGELGGFSQYIHSLKADLVYANTVIADKLDATLANIDTANISTASIQYLASQIVDAQQINAICANLGYLTSTEISANYASLNLLNSSYATIGQLQSSFVSAEVLASSYATIGQLQSSFVSANVLASSYASIDYLQNNYANINQLNTSYANVNLANITQGALERLFVDTGILTNASISTASVTGMLNSVSINASCITAGTLNVNRLNIYDDTNGIIYAINAQNVSSADLGNLTTYAQTHQFHGNDIVANSITANQIAGGTITGNEIAGNTITANHININDLSALSANIGEITAGLINGDNAYFNMNGGLVRLGSTAETWQQITENSISSKYKDISFFSIENKHINSTQSVVFDYIMTESDSWENRGSNYLYFYFDTGDAWQGQGTPYLSNPQITMPSQFDAVYTYDLDIANCQFLLLPDSDDYEYFTIGITIALSNVKKNGVAVNPDTSAWNTMIADLSAEFNEFVIDADLYWLAIDYNLGNIVYSYLYHTNYNFGYGNYLNGNGASAFGKANQISGSNAIGIGLYNDTERREAIAIGRENNIVGENSIAIGRENNLQRQDAYALGKNNYSASTYSVNIGIGNRISGGYNNFIFGRASTVSSSYGGLALGSDNYVSGTEAVVLGKGSTANNDGSIAIGRNIQSSSTVSIGIGLGVEASGKQAFAVGNNTTARGDNSVAIGFNSYSLGIRNVAIGYQARSYTGYGIVSIGDTINTTGNYAVSIGHSLDNSGVNALVLGSYNRCDGGSYTSILGYNNQSSYSFTTILGRDNEAGCNEQTVLGKYNKVNSTALFVVGNGNANVRQNALEMDDNGNLVVAGTVNEYADSVDTANHTNFITPASGITIRHCEVVRSGRMCQFTISFTKNTSVACANYGDIADITVGTLKDAYKPRVTTHFSHGGMSNPYGTDGTITKEGSMVCRTVKPRSATTFTANNTTFMARGNYLLYNKWQKTS